MATKSKKEIVNALDMQREIQELFLEAKKAGNVKSAAYLAQVWASLESHAAKEREKVKEERTAIDDLVDILGSIRADYTNRNMENSNAE